MFFVPYLYSVRGEHKIIDINYYFLPEAEWCEFSIDCVFTFVQFITVKAVSFYKRRHFSQMISYVDFFSYWNDFVQ